MNLTTWNLLTRANSDMIVTDATREHERIGTEFPGGWRYVAIERVCVAEHQERRGAHMQGALSDRVAVY